MRYLGMDVQKGQSHFYISDEEGKKVCSGRVENNEDSLRELVRKQGEGEGIAVALETGNMTFKMARAMTEAGADVFVVDTYQNALISRSMKKTDALDAKQLSSQRRLHILPEHPVYIPSEEGEDLRRLLSARFRLVKERTALSNRAIRLAERHGITNIRRGSLSKDAGWKRLMAEGGVWENTTDLLLLKQYAEDADRLRNQIGDLKTELTAHAEKYFKEGVGLLRTIPGVGPVTSAMLMAQIENIERFGSARKLCKYVGLTSGVRSSGETKHLGPISKQGNGRLRGYLTQTALYMLKHAKTEDPLMVWYQKIKERRGWRKARVALARKVLAISYGVLRHRTPYDPEYVSMCSRGDMK